jgi:hypothetical protein
MITKDSNKISILSVTLALWLAFTFIVGISPRAFALNLSYGFMSTILLSYIIYNHHKKSLDNILSICALYSISTIIPLVAKVFDGRVSVLYYWLLGFNTLLIVTCLANMPSTQKIIVARFLIVVCFVVTGLIASVDSDNIDSVSFVGGSSNLLSAALISAVCWYCFVRVQAGNKEPILVPVAMLIFAVYLGGRSGIVISCGIVLISIFFRATRSTLFALSALLVFYTLTRLSLGEILTDLIAGTRLRYGFEDDIRAEMIEEYIRGIGPITLLMGGEFNPSGVIASYGDNPHNSLIRAHHLFGIFPVAIFLILIVISVAKFLSTPTRLWAYGFALGGLILLRSYYDSVTFWFELDFAIVSLLLSPILPNAERRRDENG